MGYTRSVRRSSFPIRSGLWTAVPKSARESRVAAACSEPEGFGWEESVYRGRPIVIDSDGIELGDLQSDITDPAAQLESMGDTVATVIMPDGLDDRFLAPLTRGDQRCTLVVRDPTRIHIAPVYYRTWRRPGLVLARVKSCSNCWSWIGQATPACS